MPLSPGDKLGPYEILAPLGALDARGAQNAPNQVIFLENFFDEFAAARAGSQMTLPQRDKSGPQYLSIGA